MDFEQRSVTFIFLSILVILKFKTSVVFIMIYINWCNCLRDDIKLLCFFYNNQPKSPYLHKIAKKLNIVFQTISGIYSECNTYLRF